MERSEKDGVEANGGRRDQFVRTVQREFGFRNEKRCRHYFESFFGAVPLQDRRLLEIGCGEGLLSVYAALSGAEVVALEPEEAGSSAGSFARLRTILAQFPEARVTPRTETVQEFQAPGASFDIVISRSSINHLDEAACMTLATDPQSQARYRAVFERLRDLLSPGGTLIVTDSSRHNVFPMLGLRNPFAPTIDWRKHQSPRGWAALLDECGFTEPQISWFIPMALEPLGPLARNGVVAFFFRSVFRLQMRRR